MKTAIEKLVSSALAELSPGEDLSLPPVEIERTRDTLHGHFSCNVAMRLAKELKKSPRDIANSLVAAMPESALIKKIEVAGPGFINFHLADSAFHDELRAILIQLERYGRSSLGDGKKVLLEYVSANPTGPLHVGHGRHASYGACLANLLGATGHDVHREYYVNDAGRQMDILALSVWLRFLQAGGEEFDFPKAAYQGGYIKDIASQVSTVTSVKSPAMPADLFADLPREEKDKDLLLDRLIDRARNALGADAFSEILQLALTDILADIREDLAEFGVTYDEWFSENSLTANGAVDRALKLLANNGVTYEKGGKIWFRATDYGDEKDRVVVRDNGRTTYFASDIAYHLQKRERGYTNLVNVWGADHHGYAPRVRAGLEAMGEPADCLHIELVQFVALYKGGEKAQMSTRSGEFVTLRELRDEVGNDAARLFFVMRANEQHLDFDLDLAKSSSNDNPVYYLQYAHARVCSVMRQLEERGYEWDAGEASGNLTLLTEPQEHSLLLLLTRYPEVVEAAALQYAPQHVVYYLKDLAGEFHAYYNAHKFIVDESPLRNARLMLVLAIRQVMRNGLDMLGVSAPEHM